MWALGRNRRVADRAPVGMMSLVHSDETADSSVLSPMRAYNTAQFHNVILTIWHEPAAMKKQVELSNHRARPSIVGVGSGSEYPTLVPFQVLSHIPHLFSVVVAVVAD